MITFADSLETLLNASAWPLGSNNALVRVVQNADLTI